MWLTSHFVKRYQLIFELLLLWQLQLEEVAILLLSILTTTEVSTDNTLSAVIGCKLIEQIFLFVLFISLRKVHDGLRKMLVNRQTSAFVIKSILKNTTLVEFT